MDEGTEFRCDKLFRTRQSHGSDSYDDDRGMQVMEISHWLSL